MHPSHAPQRPSGTATARELQHDDGARGKGIQRTTLVAIITNAALAVGQVIIGLFANAFSLVADAAHTLSDLVTDLLWPWTIVDEHEAGFALEPCAPEDLDAEARDRILQRADRLRYDEFVRRGEQDDW